MTTRVFVADLEAAHRMNLTAILRSTDRVTVREGNSFAPVPAETRAALGDAQVLCVALGAVTAEVLDDAPDLRVVVKCGIGVDNIDVDAARERGIGVLRTARVNVDGPAEWVIGAAIAHLRRFAAMDRGVRQGEWAALRREWSGLVPALSGRTLGVVGVGAIGRRLAELGNAHGMTVLGHDPHVDPAELRRSGVEPVSKEEILAGSDVLSLNMVLTEATRGWISRDELAMMKAGSLLANCSRGPVVNEAALVEALERGHIGGAVLDVLELEPPDTGNPLLSLDQVLLTPHLGGCTDAGYQEIGARAAELISSLRDGREVAPDCIVVPLARALTGMS
jgi:D-3-phosphoglycerate dehydrogenase / 2-oxoglutarate reductase